MARPMVTKISLKPLIKRSCSSSGDAGNSSGSRTPSSARRRSACSAVMIPCSTPFVRTSLAIIGTDPLRLGKLEEGPRQAVDAIVLDDRRPRLPVPDRLKGVDQHDDVQSKIIANVKPDQNLERKPERDRQSNRQRSR